MSAVNAGERLAHFVAKTDGVPEEAILQAKRAVLDTLGVALAGSREESARAVAAWLGDQGGRPEAAMLGRALRLPAADAAPAHGTAAPPPPPAPPGRRAHADGARHRRLAGVRPAAELRQHDETAARRLGRP